MKKIILFSLLLILSAASFSQQTKNVKPQLTKTDYLQKSRNQKNAAWILLGGGATLIITAAVFPQGEFTGLQFDPFTLISEGHKNDGIIGALELSGVLSMLGSIPLFISSGMNKRKAMSISFKNEKVPQFMNGSIVNRPIPSLSLKINL